MDCFGFYVSKTLYFVMAVLQLIAVCLVVILWASSLVFLPMLVISSIKFLRSVGFIGRGGI